MKEPELIDVENSDYGGIYYVWHLDGQIRILTERESKERVERFERAKNKSWDWATQVIDASGKIKYKYS